MNIFRRSGLVMAALTLALHALAAAQAVLPDNTARQWSMDVWGTALKGDNSTLTRFFENVPQLAANSASAERFRLSFDLHRNNIEQARSKRDESREETVKEMREHLAAGDLSQALRDAVKVQTLSENLETAFDDPDVKRIIARAEQRIPEVEQELDWLLAQELLFYLRTLYEDTSRFADYKKVDAHLDAVNRRVSLLAQYAPRQLHELRSRRAERLSEKALADFQPGAATDWEKRVAGIRPDMLKAALKTAAAEHIESGGWRPLIRGGLEELRILATTASLEESFPKLADADLVAPWVSHIDNELALLNETKDDDLDSWVFSRILDDLLRMSEKTILLDREVLYREFGDGATYELDEYSEIIWPDKLARFRQATEGAFVGVGILIRHNEAQEIVVVNPLEGTPAYFAGVKPEDVITEVDGESTVGWALNDAVDRITGAPSTKVTLGLKREGEAELIQMTLKRDIIKLRSVMGWWKKNLRDDGAPEWDWFIDPVSRVAYIKLTQFTDDTYSDLRDAWAEINAGGKPSGLILDLRYNPGGLLTSAVDISNLFVKEGTIVSGEDKNGNEAFKAQRARPEKAEFEGVPTVVLINQGSASASEIVSGCLQAHGAAVVVGERSFGKGSVQTVHTTAPNSRMKLTTQYYRLPASREQIARGESGRLVHKRPEATVWGVDPNIQVKMTPQQIQDSLELRQQADVIPQDEQGRLNPDPAQRPDITRLLTEGMDPQLETALLILQARALGTTDIDTRHAATGTAAGS